MSPISRSRSWDRDEHARRQRSGWRPDRRGNRVCLPLVAAADRPRVCAGFFVALVLVAIAPFAEWYFEEPRVVPVIRVLALAPLIEGFTNIGVVAGFQRDLAFNKDFRFTVLRKLSSFIVTVPMALIWPNYWALAAGIVCG